MARNPVAADPIVCPSCGTKFNAERDRCPRCRTRVQQVDHAAVQAAGAARSRHLQIAGIALLSVALVAIAGVWVLAPKAESPVARPSTADPLSSRRTPAPVAPRAPAGAARPAATERPFMDAPGAGYKSYEGGDFEAALKHYEDAVAKNPLDAESLSNLGQVLIKLGRTNDALTYFDRAVALNPDRWAYVFNRARAQGLLAHWTECVRDYQRAQQLFPDDYATTYNLALALHKSGEEEGAVVQYQKAIALSPDDAVFRRALAISLERLNRKADAAAAYTEYLRLAPGAPDADKVKERIALLTGPPPAPAVAEAAKLEP